MDRTGGLRLERLLRWFPVGWNEQRAKFLN
jgi:hypothetical protein